MNQLPEGWASATVGELWAVRYGKGLPQGDRGESDPFPYVGSGGVIASTHSPLVSGAVIVVGRKGTAGSVQLFESGCWPSDTTFYLEAEKTRDALLPRLAELQLAAARLGQFERSTALPGLGREALEQQRIVVAPLAEQGRIVAAIEEAFSLLDAGETALHNTRTRLKRMRDALLTAAVTGKLLPQDPTDTHAESRMLAAGIKVEEPASPLPTGWACAQLSMLLSETIGGVWGGEPGTDEVDVRVIRVTEMKQDGTLEPSTAALRSIKSSQLRSRRLGYGDVLLEKSGGGPTRAVGRVGMVRKVEDPSVCANFMQLMRAERRVVMPEYLELLLRQFHASGGTSVLQTATTNIRNLKMKDYFTQVHAVPPLEEQARIVAEVERQFSFIDAAERAVDEGLRRSAALRRSVLRAAFEGRLVPQDPADEPASVLLERIAAERASAAPKKRAPRRARGKAEVS